MKKIIIAVIIISIVGIVYFYSQNKFDISQLLRTSDVAEIKYNNQEFGFEFMLPRDWKETKTDKFNGITFLKSENEAAFQKEIKSDSVMEGDGSAVVAMDIILFVIPLSAIELEAHIAEFKQYNADLSDIKVNGNTATRIRVNERFGGGSEEHYIFINGNNGVLIFGQFTDPESSKNELKTVLGRAVSTFSFTK